jgi:hypothetical protein
MKLSLKTAVAVVAVAAACGSSSSRDGFDGPLPPGDGPPPIGSATGTLPPGNPPAPTDDSPCGQAAAAKGYAGCDFRVAPPPVKGMITDKAPCYAVFVTNVAKQNAHLEVSLGPNKYDYTKFARTPNGIPDPAQWTPIDASGVPPGAMAVLFMSDDPTAQSINFDNEFCAVKPAIEDATGQAILLPGRATTFHITSDQPVVAYDMAPFGGARSYAPSAQILLPTTAWGKNYVGVVPPMDPWHPDDPQGQNSWFMVAATEDGTTVEVATKNVDLDGQGPDAVPAGSKKVIALAAGEYVQWAAPRINGKDASGTVFTSNKPVSLTIGDIWLGIASNTSEHQQQKMPDGTPFGAPEFCCMDGGHQMLAPVSAMGSAYVGAPFPSRLSSGADESIKYRVLGLVDGTTLTFDPPVPGAPSTIAQGQVIDIESTAAFHVKSQDDKHPFYVAQTMSYASTLGGTKQDGTDGVFKVQTPLPLGLGDPEFVNLLPAGQFLDDYTFLTDPSYATTSLVVVRQKDDKGFHDVSLECLGANLTGWLPVGSGATYEWTRLDLQRKYVPNAKCSVNAHKAKSDGKFSVQVWGVDWWASYGYPAGGSAAKINDVVVGPPH